MDHRMRLAASSRDGHLALRRVERQQAIIELLHASNGRPRSLADLAQDLGVSARTVARDVERLRTSGVPLVTTPGRAGGVALVRVRSTIDLRLDLAEAASIMSSLAVLGPSVTPSASSVMRKLVEALADGQGDDLEAERPRRRS